MDLKIINSLFAGVGEGESDKHIQSPSSIISEEMKTSKMEK